MSGELRRLAKEATPGPWHSDGILRAEIADDEARYTDLVRVPTQDGRALAATWAWPVFDRREQAVANAAYIAAASPDVVLGLLGRVAALEKALRPLLEARHNQSHIGDLADGGAFGPGCPFCAPVWDLLVTEDTSD